MQSLIVIKLFVMSFIGIATSLGQPVDIPIILRSLADSIALVDGNDRMPVLSAGFLSMLDIGAHNKDNKCRVVGAYNIDWWSGRKPRNCDDVEVLNSSNVQYCLDHYGRQIARPTEGVGAGNLSDGNSGIVHNSGSTDSAGSHSMAGPGPTFPDETIQCQKCSKYRQLLSDVLLDTLRFRNYASTMSTASWNLINIRLRRTSTFHQLYEAAITKETTVSSPAPAPTLPASSYKWTWGETLSNSEVLDLRPDHPGSGAAHHSGYNLSLPDGRFAGEYSEQHSGSSDPQGEYNHLSADMCLNPPDTDHSLPSYFDEHRQSYRSRQVPSSRTSPPFRILHTTKSLFPFKDDQPMALQIADAWELDPDTEAGAGTGTCSDSYDVSLQSQQLDALHLADIWIDEDNNGTGSGTNSPHDNVPAEISPPHPHIADMWDDNHGMTEIDPPQSSEAPALFLADVWPDNDVHGIEEASPVTVEPHEEASQTPQISSLSLADIWRDDDYLGDEELSPGPADHLIVADHWIDDESIVSQPAPVEFDSLDGYSGIPVPSTPAPAVTFRAQKFVFISQNEFDGMSSSDED